jgi:hypothetical protein
MKNGGNEHHDVVERRKIILFALREGGNVRKYVG